MNKNLPGRRIRIPFAYLLPLILLVSLFWPQVAGSLFPSRTEMTYTEFKTALAAWEEREKFIADQKSTLVISYRWTRYNDYLRSFNPLWRMRDWAAKK